MRGHGGRCACVEEQLGGLEMPLRGCEMQGRGAVARDEGEVRAVGQEQLREAGVAGLGGDHERREAVDGVAEIDRMRVVEEQRGDFEALEVHCRVQRGPRRRR